MSKIKLPIAAVVAAAAGLVVLLGYFLPLPALQPIRDLLLNWAAILTGVAVLVGILNMVGAHWQRLSQPKKPRCRQPGAGASLLGHRSRGHLA